MNKQNLVWVAIVVVAIFALYGAFKVTTNVVNNVPPFQASGGGAAGPDDTSSNHSVGGIRRFFFSSGMNQGSTTICSFQSPTATSTLVSNTVTFTTGTTTVVVVDIARAAQGNTATTTLLGAEVSIPSTLQVTIVGSTSPATTNALFSPNQWLNVKVGSYLGSANVFVGRCQATFETVLFN